MIKLTFKYIDFGLQIFFIFLTMFVSFFASEKAYLCVSIFGGFQFCSAIINSIIYKVQNKLTFGRVFYNFSTLVILIIAGILIFSNGESTSSHNPYNVGYLLAGFVLLFTSPILAIWYLIITLRELINLQKAEKLGKVN